MKLSWMKMTVAAAAKLLQSCPTLCDPIDGSPPGSPVPGILQARTLEWVAISFFNAWKWKVKVKQLSLIQLLATPWTAAHQAPPSIGFSRQEYWSGVPSPSLHTIHTHPEKRCVLHTPAQELLCSSSSAEGNKKWTKAHGFLKRFGGLRRQAWLILLLSNYCWCIMLRWFLSTFQNKFYWSKKTFFKIFIGV